jgi:nucleoside-diphosphate-sugar epimerase
MDSAIVVGGNGLIGRSLVCHLMRLGIPTIVIGTSEYLNSQIAATPQDGRLEYIRVKPWGLEYDEVHHKLKMSSCLSRGAVMFNLAWRGAAALVDGNLTSQLNNVALACDFLKLARNLSVNKYVGIGSIEEIVYERIIAGDQWQEAYRRSSYSRYGLSKKAARLQSSFQAYTQQIDFCYVYISIVIDKKLRTPKFVEQSLRSIYASPILPTVTNPELCSITSSEEIARQLAIVGQLGKNKSTYTLGNGKCATLMSYFELFSKLRHKNPLQPNERVENGLRMYTFERDFMIDLLTTETGYSPFESTEDLFNEIISLV